MSTRLARQKSKRLSEQLEGISDLETVLGIGDVHHVSLAVYEDLPAQRFATDLARFAEAVQPITVRLANIGIFAGARSVLFLSPVVTEQLLALHHRFHDAFGAFAGSCWEHYRPGRWVPHVTLAMNAASPSLQKAVTEVTTRWKPLEIQLDAIRLVRFRPVHTIYRATLQAEHLRDGKR
jgi:2'-5' RNA ligase